MLRLPSSMHGAEIEIHEVGAGHEDPHTHPHHHGGQEHDHEHGGHHHPHVAVVERPDADGTQFTAVFPDVREGSYDLREHGGTTTVRVQVVGGAVTEADWAQAD